MKIEEVETLPVVLNHRYKQQRELQKQELSLQWEIMELEDLADATDNAEFRTSTYESILDRVAKLAEARRQLALEKSILLCFN